MAEQTGSLLDEKQEIRTHRDATAWLDAFRKTDELSHIMGLLHDGLVHFSHDPKIVWHYLDIANGYRRDGDHNRYAWFDGRQVNPRVAPKKKAFKMLCEHFFRGPKPDEKQAPWRRLVTNPEVFEKVLWFLDQRHRDNLPHDFDDSRHQAEVFYGFVKDFIRLVLRHFHAWDEPGEEVMRIQKMFLDARPRIIALMVDVDCLDILLRFDDPFGPPVYLDEASMTQLEEIALRDHLDKKHESLSSAAIAKIGSDNKVARAMIVLRALQEEHLRQEKKHEAELAAAEEADRQTELHQAEQAVIEAAEKLAELRDAAELGVAVTPPKSTES